MSSFKFVIRKDVPNKSGFCKIYLRYTHNSKWFNIPTSQNVRPEHWNDEEGLPRRNHPYRTELESELKIVEDKARKLKNRLVLEGKDVSVENLKELFKLVPVITQQFSFIDIYTEFIKSKKNEITKNTLKSYNTTIKHLIEYCSHNKRALNWDLFDDNFEHEWNNYFYENDISNGANGKYFKTLKTFLKWAHDKRYLNSDKFKEYKAKITEPEIYPLKESELEKISKYIDVENKTCTEQERKIGTMFLFMCYSSLRFSDLQRLTFSMINKGKKGYKDGEIRLDTQKTDTLISVPLTSKVIKQICRIHPLFGITIIGTMYDHSIKGTITNIKPDELVFPKISNQKFNQYIKELCSKIGFERKVRVIRRVGTKRNTIHKSLWQTISSHTGRRTFITLSLEKGMRPETIMCITGHSDTRTMYKYNKVTSDVVIKETLKSWDNESEDELKSLLKNVVEKVVEDRKKKEPIKMKTSSSNNKLKNPNKNPFNPPDWIDTDDVV